MGVRSGVMQERAAARALSRVLRRVASPVRHELAGGLLLPQVQLQILRRRLQAPGATMEKAIAGIDHALLCLLRMRSLHQYCVSWFALHDETPLGVDEAVRKAAAGFALPFSAKGVNVSCDLPIPGPRYAAQPLHLLVHACFYAVLDSELAPGVLEVACRRGANGATLEWRLNTKARVDRPDEDAEAPIAPALRLDLADVQALCAGYGCRFSHRAQRWTLRLGRVTTPDPLSPDGSAYHDD